MSRDTTLTWGTETQRAAEFADESLQDTSLSDGKYSPMKTVGVHNYLVTPKNLTLAVANNFFQDGSFGQVFNAENQKGDQFAIKVISINTMSWSYNWDAESKNRAVNEVVKKEKEQLEKVGELVDYVEFTYPTDQNPTYMFVMRHRGTDMFDYLISKDLADGQRPDLAIDTVDKVLKLHRDKELAHLDIKPENLAVDHKIKPHLLDFGASSALDHKATYCGTSAYHPKRSDNDKTTLYKKLTNMELDCFALMRTLYYDRKINSDRPSILTEQYINASPMLKKMFEEAGVLDEYQTDKIKIPTTLQLKKILFLATENFTLTDDNYNKIMGIMGLDTDAEREMDSIISAQKSIPYILSGLNKALDYQRGIRFEDSKKVDACTEFTTDLSQPCTKKDVIHTLKHAARILSHRRWAPLSARTEDKKSNSYAAAESDFEAARKILGITDEEWKGVLVNNPTQTCSVITPSMTYRLFSPRKATAARPEAAPTTTQQAAPAAAPKTASSAANQ